MLLEVIWSPIHYVGPPIDSGGHWMRRGAGLPAKQLNTKTTANVWLISDTERFNRGGHVSVLVTYITALMAHSGQ
jgi:hypothetical protein